MRKLGRTLTTLGVLTALGLGSFGTSYALWSHSVSGSGVTHFAGNPTPDPDRIGNYLPIRNNGSIEQIQDMIGLGGTSTKTNTLLTKNQAFITMDETQTTKPVYVGYQLELDTSKPFTPQTYKALVRVNTPYYNDADFWYIPQNCKVVYDEIEQKSFDTTYGVNKLSEYAKVNYEGYETLLHPEDTYREEHLNTIRNYKYFGANQDNGFNLEIDTGKPKGCLVLRDTFANVKDKWYKASDNYSSTPQERRVDQSNYGKWSPSGHKNTVTLKKDDQVIDSDEFKIDWLKNHNAQEGEESNKVEFPIQILVLREDLAKFCNTFYSYGHIVPTSN